MLIDTISIKLSKGQIAIVDKRDADLEELNWYAAYFPKYANKGNYIARRMDTADGKQVNRQMHRVILERMLGRKLERHEICDHINGNPLDNRRSNLRLATYAQNSRNAAKNKRNTTGYKGVTWNKRTQKYCAQIQVDGKRIYLGSFDDPAIAYESYVTAAKTYHGEYARLI